MKPADDLHQLISRMTMSEKRHFKIYAQRHTSHSENNYQLLFDAIAAQSIYDEPEIKKIFFEKKFIKHLPSEKNYLYSLLLEALNIYNKDKTLLSRYANTLISIEWLYNKGLLKQAQKLINKSKPEAYALEKFSLLLLLLRWEIIIAINSENEQALHVCVAEELRILELMRVQTHLLRIAFHVQINIDKGNASAAFVRKTERELKAHYPREAVNRTFWAQYYYHSTIGLLRSTQHKQRERYEAFMAIKKLMEQSSQFIVDLPQIYHLNNNNLVNVMFYLKKFDEAEALIAQQRRFMPTYGIKRQQLEKIIYLNTLESEIYLHCAMHNNQKAVLISRAAESAINKTDARANPVLYDTLFMMATAEVMTKNYKASARWLNKILNAADEVNLRKEIKINARLLFLIILHETADRLFDARYKEARKFLGPGSTFTLHRKILSAMKLLAEADEREKIQKTITEIKTMLKKSPEMALNKQFDFVWWLEEKVNKL